MKNQETEKNGSQGQTAESRRQSFQHAATGKHDMVVLVALLAIVGLMAPARPAWADRREDAEKLYRQIKSLEERLPIGTASETIEVGEFDASTGKFKGMTSETRQRIYDGPRREETKMRYVGNKKIVTRISGKKMTIEVTASPFINATAARLKFTIKNSRGQASVTAKFGREEVTVRGRTSVTVDVRDASSVQWTIRSGSKAFSNNLEIRRPPVFVGVYKIPAWPVLVLYEPPPDRRRVAKTIHEWTHTFGTTTSWQVKTEENTTRPSTPTRFTSEQDMKSMLNGLAEFLDTATSNGFIPGGGDLGISGPLRAIASGLGEMSAQQKEGTVVVKEGATSIKITSSARKSTGDNDGGPGIGDVIYFLYDVKVLMVRPVFGQTSACILDWEALVGASIPRLQEGNVLGLDRETCDALLALDPFVGDSDPELPTNRFRRIEVPILDGTGTKESISLETDETEVNKQAKTTYTVKIEDYSPGWLSVFGLGVTQRETLMTKMSKTSAVETFETTKSKATVEYYCERDELYGVAVYVDDVFGTFALKIPEILVEGVARSRRGSPLRRKIVTLISSGRRYTTLTNDQGRFMFQSADIKPGQITLEAGGVTQRLRLERGVPLRNIQLQPQAVRPFEQGIRPKRPIRPKR